MENYNPIILFAALFLIFSKQTEYYLLPLILNSLTFAAVINSNNNIYNSNAFERLPIRYKSEAVLRGGVPLGFLFRS